MRGCERGEVVLGGVTGCDGCEGKERLVSEGIIQSSTQRQSCCPRDSRNIGIYSHNKH